MDHSFLLTQWNQAMPCRATQDGRVMVESSDKTCSAGEGNGKNASVFLPWEPHKLIKWEIYRVNLDFIYLVMHL